MKLLSGKEYTIDISDLKVIVHKVYYQNDIYVKAKCSLVNKKNGIVYDLQKTFKLLKKRIKHWEII